MEQNIEEQTQSPEEKKETRSVFIGAKVTPGQKEYIKSQAEQCGMTVSDYLLACAYNYRPRPRLSKEETDLLQNLDNCRSDLVKYTSWNVHKATNDIVQSGAVHGRLAQRAWLYC